ncbi:MAG: hypothetical protein WBN96_04425 [Gammaproteobacteria bacterium]
MNTIKTISVLGAAVLLASSLGSAVAEDADQTRSQDRIREELNLQTPDAEQAQDRVREQSMDRLHQADGEADGKLEKKMQQKKHQVRNEQKYKESSETRQSGMGSGSMARPGR